MSKGFSEAMGLAIVTFFAVALVANLGLERTATLKDRIALNTVDLAAERVEVALYTMEAVEEGSLQIRFMDKYNLTRQNGERYILYDFDSYIPSEDATRRARIDPPVGFSMEEGRSKVFCIEKKQNGLSIEPGEC